MLQRLRHGGTGPPELLPEAALLEAAAAELRAHPLLAIGACFAPHQLVVSAFQPGLAVGAGCSEPALALLALLVPERLVVWPPLAGLGGWRLSGCHATAVCCCTDCCMHSGKAGLRV